MHLTEVVDYVLIQIFLFWPEWRLQLESRAREASTQVKITISKPVCFNHEVHLKQVLTLTSTCNDEFSGVLRVNVFSTIHVKSQLVPPSIRAAFLCNLI